MNFDRTFLTYELCCLTKFKYILSWMISAAAAAAASNQDCLVCSTIHLPTDQFSSSKKNIHSHFQNCVFCTMCSISSILLLSNHNIFFRIYHVAVQFLTNKLECLVAFFISSFLLEEMFRSQLIVALSTDSHI